MREIELLPPSRFTSRIKELGMQKESINYSKIGRGAKQIASKILPKVTANAPAAAAPVAKAVAKKPGFLMRHLWKLLGLGAAGTAVGAGALGGGTLAWSGATRLGKEQRAKEDLMRDIRRRLYEAPPSANDPVGTDKAMKAMQASYTFDPGSGTYRSRSGRMLGNSAYNRRLGSLIRSYSGVTPQGHAKLVKDWDAKRRSDVDELMRKYENMRAPSFLRPDFYRGVKDEFKGNIKGMGNGVRSMFGA